MVDRDDRGTLAERLTALFKSKTNPGTRKPWTDREVAARVGCSHTTIGNLRTGKLLDTQSRILVRLAEVFDVDIDTLLGADRRPVLDGEAFSIALRTNGLTPAGRKMIKTVLEEIEELESQLRNPPAGGDNNT